MPLLYKEVNTNCKIKREQQKKENNTKKLRFERIKSTQTHERSKK